MSTLLIDQRRRCAVLNNQQIRLTPQEYRILDCLSEQPGEVISKQALLAAMWGVGKEGRGEDNTVTAEGNPMAVDLAIFRLRKKLRDSARSPIYVETRRGFGYILHNARRIITNEATADTNISSSGSHPSGSYEAPKLLQRPVLTSFTDELLNGVEQWAMLTQREWDIFMLLGQEEAAHLTNRALAHQLVMAENTLKKHLQNLYRKLNVGNRSAASILSARVQLHLYTEQQFIQGATP